MYEVKTYRQVIYHDNEEWCKIWRGVHLTFSKLTPHFDGFLPDHSNFSKICTLMGFFWTKYIMFEDMFINMRQACGHWKIGKNTYSVTKWSLSMLQS